MLYCYLASRTDVTKVKMAYTINIPACFAYARSAELLETYITNGVATGDFPASVIAADGNVAPEISTFVLTHPLYEDQGLAEARREVAGKQSFANTTEKQFPQWKVVIKDTWLVPSNAETNDNKLVRILIPRSVVLFPDLLAEYVNTAVTAEPKLVSCASDAVASVLADIEKHNYRTVLSWENVAKFEIHALQSPNKTQQYIMACVQGPVSFTYLIVGRSLLGDEC